MMTMANDDDMVVNDDECMLMYEYVFRRMMADSV